MSRTSLLRSQTRLPAPRPGHRRRSPAVQRSGDYTTARIARSGLVSFVQCITVHKVKRLCQLYLRDERSEDYTFGISRRKDYTCGAHFPWPQLSIEELNRELRSLSAMPKTSATRTSRSDDADVTGPDVHSLWGANSSARDGGVTGMCQ